MTLSIIEIYRMKNQWDPKRSRINPTPHAARIKPTEPQNRSRPNRARLRPKARKVVLSMIGKSELSKKANTTVKSTNQKNPCMRPIPLMAMIAPIPPIINRDLTWPILSLHIPHIGAAPIETNGITDESVPICNPLNPKSR